MLAPRKILVSGTSSGLGRYLAEAFDATVCISRETPLSFDLHADACSPYDMIIHCAANSQRDVPLNELGAYLNDNVILTEQLTQIPHKTFVYLSTISVYTPEESRVCTEDDELVLGEMSNLYTTTKLMSEALVRSACERHLILRPTSLLGVNSRPSSIIKILSGEPCSLTLAGDSAFNCILHSDVYEFIEKAVEGGAIGIFNLASQSKVRLNEIVGSDNKQVKFGSYHYKIGTIDNRKAAAIHEPFDEPSSVVIERFRALMGY